MIQLGEALEQASCSGKFRTHAHRKGWRLTRGGLGGETAAIFFDELDERKAGSVRHERAKEENQKRSDEGRSETEMWGRPRLRKLADEVGSIGFKEFGLG